MKMSVESAKTKFWRIPELVGTLLNFLDANSILRLAACHNLVKELSQTRLVQAGQEDLPGWNTRMAPQFQNCCDREQEEDGPPV